MAAIEYPHRAAPRPELEIHIAELRKPTNNLMETLRVLSEFQSPVPSARVFERIPGATRIGIGTQLSLASALDLTEFQLLPSRRIERVYTVTELYRALVAEAEPQGGDFRALSTEQLRKVLVRALGLSVPKIE